MQKKVFEKLFEGYLQNTLSQLETDELMKAMNDGLYDDFVKEQIDISLRDEEIAFEMDQQQGDSILKGILSKPVNTPTLVPFIKKKKRSTRFILAAASVTAILLMASVFFFKSNHSLPDASVQKNIKQDFTMAFSGKQLIHLPDGSTVLLNNKSSLTYNQDSFNKKTREVILTGEAYFDIKRNEEKTFIVHTGKVETKVLGTAFNIDARNSSQNIEVTVTRGKVQVGNAQKIYGIITPNEQIKVNKKTLDFEQKKISADLVTQWKSNYLILDDINIKEAASLISKKYNVQILLSNEKINNCRITASFLNDEDLEHVLKVVCSVIETEYRYTAKGSILLEGKGCE
ncbi:FecR family protein [Flavobacterium pectinovorum]|uniref:FecR family protein n=1 Tax=Flavobacterium pectinovorum TaxID=29533 RepID=UPI001FAE6E01|nr:FecR domain-containing protein [Flavobacterium pectinovorum]MCI9843576.1 FecR family protein [Flavobacterium pectinovorum]